MKYMMIIDSDDRLSEDAIEKLKETLFVSDEGATYCFEVENIKELPLPEKIH